MRLGEAICSLCGAIFRPPAASFTHAVNRPREIPVCTRCRMKRARERKQAAKEKR